MIFSDWQKTEWIFRSVWLTLWWPTDKMKQEKKQDPVSTLQKTGWTILSLSWSCLVWKRVSLWMWSLGGSQQTFFCAFGRFRHGEDKQTNDPASLLLVASGSGNLAGSWPVRGLSFAKTNSLPFFKKKKVNRRKDRKKSPSNQSLLPRNNKNKDNNKKSLSQVSFFLASN